MRRIIAVLLTVFVPFAIQAQKACYQEGYKPLRTQLATSVTPLSHTTLAHDNNPAGKTAAETITIPVVVHVLSATISDAQVQSQIDALNRDFNGLNADLANVPDRFRRVVGKAGFKFVLASVDPAGNATNGIVRKKTGIANFSLDDRIKFSAKGGDDAWTSSHYLNIWVGPMVSGILGYASVPGDDANIDGVVLNETVFGTIGKLGANTMGRVAVHEVGHWLGLKHIWGDGYCGDDGIDDTPQQKSYNRGCPSGIKQSCGGDPNGDMYMNFMDLTDDACMYMFTEGQKRKMRSQFQSGGARAALLSSGALGPVGTVLDPNWNQNKEVKEISIQAINLYPVPANRDLTVDLVSGAKVSRLMVFNMMGQVVMTIPVTKARTIIDLGGLKAGQYIIRTDLAGAASEKFVKL